MIGPTMVNKNSLFESLIRGNSIAMRKNKIKPVSASVHRLKATLISRENNWK